MSGFDMSAGDSYIRALTKDDFVEHVGSGSGDDGDAWTMVAFLVPWCGHCKRLIPRLELVGHAFEKEPRVNLAKVDCDAHPELKAPFGITAFPTLLAFEPGSTMQATDKYQGDWTPNDVLEWVNRVAGTQAVMRGPAETAGTVPSLTDAAKAKMRARMERERMGGGGGGAVGTGE